MPEFSTTGGFVIVPSEQSPSIILRLGKYGKGLHAYLGSDKVAFLGCSSGDRILVKLVRL